MSAPNIPIKVIRKVRDDLNSVSPSFCLAKWLQVTIHLQNGHTHSCHHPIVHKIPLHEVKKNPSALHNTSKKMLARKDMLEGVPTPECEYCWKIENVHPDNLSDRSIKSAQPWALPRFNEIKKSAWNAHVNPAYVEVSFGNECNFRCAYCAPHISSAIMTEVKKFGNYSAQGTFSIESLKESGLYPLSKDEPNPYVDAFWKWWPAINKDLKVFRITGGEPLLNPNTFRFLEFIKSNPLPDLTVAINSNLGVPAATFEKFIQEVKYITDNKLVKEFQLFTSVDTYGKNAEFVRFGLNYNEFMANAKTYLEKVKNSELIFMCAYNAFSVVNFRKFLEDITALKSSYFDEAGNTRVTLDMPYLKDPYFLSCYVLTPDFQKYIEEDIQYMKTHSHLKDGREIYYQSEIFKLERILNWLSSLEDSEHRNNNRRELSLFLKEFSERKEIKVEDYLPEYSEFINFCHSLRSNS